MFYYNFGKAFKRLRKEKGLTQEDVADLLGCAVSTVSKIENGKQMPSFSSFEVAMQLLGEDSQDYFSFILSGEDQFGYTNLDELRRLANELRLDELRILVKELDNRKPFDERFFMQFLQYCKIISDETITETERLERLLETIKISKKKFSVDDIYSYLLTYNEITIINRIAVTYFNLNERKIAVQILYDVKNSMDANYANSWEKARTYPTIMYNLSKCLGLMEHYEEAYEISLTAKHWAVKYNNTKLLPSIFVNLAHCSYLKKDMEKLHEYLLQAYFTAQGMEQHQLANIIVEGAKREYNIELDKLRKSILL